MNKVNEWQEMTFLRFLVEVLTIEELKRTQVNHIDFNFLHPFLTMYLRSLTIQLGRLPCTTRAADLHHGILAALTHGVESLVKMLGNVRGGRHADENQDGHRDRSDRSSGRRFLPSGEQEGGEELYERAVSLSFSSHDLD